VIYEGCVGLESFTRDPIGYRGSPYDLYEYVDAQPLRKTDPSGKLGVPGCVADPYTDPPTTPFSGTKCRIAVRCGPATYSGVRVGTHCGLIVETDDGISSVDGTGGCENNFNWVTPVVDYGTTGPFTDFDISVCECLRTRSKQWNDMDLPRDPFGNNSNTSLGCLTKKCGVSIDFGSSGAPSGFERKCCFKWGISLPCHHSPSPPRPCLQEGDCCDKIW